MRALLEILSDGKFHSGEEVAEILAVSRTAVWKRISKLKELGLEISSVTGKGYRIAGGLELLSERAITGNLTQQAKRVFPSLDIELTTGSTNNRVMDAMPSDNPVVCLAEHQTSGRGRRGRQWVSPFGKNLYLSIGWTFQNLAYSLDGLSLCAGIALVKGIKNIGIEGIGLKWPNDLLYNYQKVAGILIELVGELSGPVQVVIGVGVNVDMQVGEGRAIDQDWTTLAEIKGGKPSRNELAGQILNQLAIMLPQFEVEGFAAFADQWNSLDAFKGTQVTLAIADRDVTGIAKGVAADGALLIETGEGLKSFRGGEVSVRNYS